MDLVCLHCCCTKRGRICGIRNRCETSSYSIGALLRRRGYGVTGNEKLRWVSLCLYLTSYRANTSLGARGEATLSLSGRPDGGVDHVKGVGRS